MSREVQPEVIPKRYLFASMFIAAMLMLLAIVQAPRSIHEGGAVAESASVELSMASFEPLTEYRLEDGWAPRFQGAQDPDQEQPWPFGGGFETPWEPASAYLGDGGLALNGPQGHSEVVIWRGLEWRHYRFTTPIASARLDPTHANRLLVTLALGQGRFETRLMEIPEGRVLWSVDSGPWSRFSWDGRAVLLGLRGPGPEPALLLTSLPAEADRPETTLAPWDERQLPAPPRGWAVKQEQLWDDGKDLPGPRVLIPWPAGSRLWFPSRDRLWTTAGSQWTLWGLDGGTWRRLASGQGILAAHPPLAMALVAPARKGESLRSTSPPDRADWTPVPPDRPSWPGYDPAWLWWRDGFAATAWDQRWGNPDQPLASERQREALIKAFRAEWRTASDLRSSVKAWIPDGPEVALREAQSVAWIWVGDRAILVRLQPAARLKSVREALKR